MLFRSGLHDAAQALVRSLEGAGDQRADYWKHRVMPYLQSIWPKLREKNSPAISENLAMLCVVAQEAFPEAFEVLRHWLLPPEYPDYLVSRLHEARLCETFPDIALAFLNMVISNDTQWPPTNLKECLKDIQTAKPQLAADARYQRLTDYLRKHGQV